MANNTNKKVFLVEQENKLTRLLLGNNKASRDKALKNLKKWFSDRTQIIAFTEEDFQRIWKGLFYSMWMSDKPLVQEECAESIANLVHFPDIKTSLLFFKCGLSTLINEWFGIDQLRLDKFLMLVRRLLRHMFMAMKNHRFNKTNIKLFNDVLLETILSSNMKVNLGLFMHFVEIFLEELAKVSEGKIDQDRIVDMLQPFIIKLATTNDGREIGYLRKFIFTYLITQSDLGLEYREKYNAWKELGFPGSINSIQKIKMSNENDADDDDEENTDIEKEKPLDPRAGRVDVELPQLKFNAKKLANLLLEQKYDKASSKKSREMISVLADQFTKLSSGIYPLGIKKLQVEKTIDNYDTNVRKAANRLIKFEQKLLGKNKKRTRTEQNQEEEFEPKRKKIAKENRVSQETKSDSGKFEDDKQKEKSPLKIDNNKKKIVKSTKILTASGQNKNNSNTDINDTSEITDHNLRSKSMPNMISRRVEQPGRIKKVKNNLRLVKKQRILNNIECIFERNSGTWIVFDISSEKKQHNIPSKIGNQNLSSANMNIKQNIVPSSNTNETSNIPIQEKLNNITPIIQHTLKQAEAVNSTDLMFDTILDKSPTIGINSSSEIDSSPLTFKWERSTRNTKISVSPKTLRRNTIKVTETNITPFQKIKGKSRLSLDSTAHITQNKLVTKQLSAKSRLSLDPNLIKDPFQTPNKLKRVKINTKLNMSQEFDEHHRLILRSPGIPYDANKKPLKPLLKTPVKSTPINPFYNNSMILRKVTLL